MYRIPISFHNRLMRGEIPIAYAIINTHLGYRIYSEKELSNIFDVLGHLADGSYTADGSHTAGSESLGIIDKAARVLDLGNFERTIQPRKDDVLTAYETKQIQHLSIQLDNADRYFSQLIPKEPFLSRDIYIYIGFEADPQSEHISLFKGVVSEISMLPIMTLEADEQ